jgi:hypothetical protein
MIGFQFESTFGGSGQWNKIFPAKQSEAYRGSYDNYIRFEIKGVHGSVLVPQPHITNVDWSYMVKDTPKDDPYILWGKCTDKHAAMILQYIQGKKWQSKIKKSYSARNRWYNGKAV